MSGFHQIELEETPNSLRRMMLTFSGLEPFQAFLYMDDLMVIGCSEKHMIKNLTDVLLCM